MPGPTVLMTSRLMLRPLRLADSAAIFVYRSDPRVARFQVWEPRDQGEVRTFIENLRDTAPDTPGTWYQLAIVLRENGDLIGDSGFHFPTSKPHEVEVGITVSPPHQRRGYATEALLCVIEYLFVTLGKHRVYARVDPRNTVSMALLERVGMTKQGPIRYAECAMGESADDVIYAIHGEVLTYPGRVGPVRPAAGSR